VTTAFGDQGADHAPGRGGGALAQWIGRNPVAALVIAVAIILALWLVLAPWPAGFEEVDYISNRNTGDPGLEDVGGPESFKI